MESNDQNILSGSCDLLCRDGNGFGLRLSLDLRFEAGRMMLRYQAKGLHGRFRPMQSLNVMKSAVNYAGVSEPDFLVFSPKSPRDFWVSANSGHPDGEQFSRLVTASL